MQSFHDFWQTNLSMAFEMSYIYHQVTILVYKILIQKIYIINTLFRNKTIIVSRLKI